MPKCRMTFVGILAMNMALVACGAADAPSNPETTVARERSENLSDGRSEAREQGPETPIDKQRAVANITFKLGGESIALFDQICTTIGQNNMLVATGGDDGFTDILKLRIPKDPEYAYGLTTFEYTDVREGEQIIWTASDFNHSFYDSVYDVTGIVSGTRRKLLDDGNYDIFNTTSAGVDQEFSLKAECN